MSRSTTYRPRVLSAEELAEIAHGAHMERLHQDLIPELRARLRARLGERANLGIARGELGALERTIRSAASIVELRAVAETLETHRLSLGEPETSAATVSSDEHSARAGATPKPLLAFDLDQVEATLASLERTAAGLRVEMQDVEVARQSLAQARLLMSSGRRDRAADALASATEVVARLDAIVDETLAAAEWQSRVGAIVTETLANLGYRVEQTTDADGVILNARAADGRWAEVTIDGDGSDGGVQVVVEDAADAVGPEHPEALTICQSAMDVQLEVQMALNHVAGLRTSRPVAVGKPTRGQGVARHPSSVRSRRAQATAARREQGAR